MLYYFSKILMTLGLRFFYKHLHVSGFENIPSTGPVIIIANHNSSLMDAALLGVLLKRKAWFFARGDVFINKPVQKLLWWFHMMPVHSHAGNGKKSWNANRDSFSDGQRILLNGGIVVFFPESYSHIEHRLLPFRKGVFRLAFDTAAASDYAFEIPIVPVGINYDHPVASRTEVQVHVGKPLLLSNYTNLYRQNAAAALLRVCTDAYQAMNKLVLHVASKDRCETAEMYLTVSRNNRPVNDASWKIHSSKKLLQEQKVCALIDEAADQDYINKKQTADTYFSRLAATDMSDRLAAGHAPIPAWKKTILLYCFPIYAAGLFLNALPVLTAKQVADKKVSRKDFYSWIFVVSYSFLYVFWLIILLVVFDFIAWQYALGLTSLAIVLGVFAYTYAGRWQEYRQQQKWMLLPDETKTELITLRKNLQAAFR